MNAETLLDTMTSLGNALDRFGEAVARPDPDELAVDGTIQRFEFTFELFWKTLRRFLQQEGIDTGSPKNTLRHAYRRGLLDREQLWLDMLEDRILSSHVYNVEMARELFARLPSHQQALRACFEELQRRMGGTDRYSIARTISSVIFLASPNSIIVLSL
jgi:nucleotidyltransferase substrate binding protein (TIGR01987 family)